MNARNFVVELKFKSVVICKKKIHRSIFLLVYIKFPHVEAGSNTSIVPLRVVEVDEKRTRCLGV
jgi:hypothetical protein